MVFLVAPVLQFAAAYIISGSEYVDVALFQANLTTIHQYYKHRAAGFATCSCFMGGFQFVTNIVLQWSDHGDWCIPHVAMSIYIHYKTDNHTWIYYIRFILVCCAPLCLLVDTFDQLKPTRSVVSNNCSYNSWHYDIYIYIKCLK